MKRGSKRADEAFGIFGGACQRCGYSRCRRAMHFHHIDASAKQVWSGTRGGASFDEVLAHPERFLLLCANCHAEEHDALTQAARRFVPCQHCGKALPATEIRQEDGRGRYCSHACQHVARKTRSLTLEGRTARFWKHIQKRDGCWLWVGTRDKRHGMGVFAYSDEQDRRYTHLVHRFSYEQHVGPIPPNTYVLQSCTNKLCVRPDHLYLRRKGRMPRAGWQVPHAATA